MQRLELQVDLGTGQIGQRTRMDERRPDDRARDRLGGGTDGVDGDGHVGVGTDDCCGDGLLRQPTPPMVNSI